MHSEENMAFGSSASQIQSLPSGSGGSYDGKIAGLYDLEETLGSGHFAVVKLARHVFTGAKVAVKVVDKTKLDEISKAHLFQEVRCMKLVQHPNVVRLYEVIDTPTKLYLVLELGDGGDLYDYIMKHEGGLSEEYARKYFKQILKAITYCHQLHVVHRDLKPENVVFFEKIGVVKLTDFGFSNKFSPGQKLETFCGSLAYSAPEILLGDSYDAPAVDIWSLGVILYMLVCGQPPFEKANDSETLTMIMDCKYTVPPQISSQCKQLISSMLVRDPKNRATLEQIAAHPWVNEISDFDATDSLPLISRQELSDDDHAFIIQKMINGNIAPKEDILLALDKNQYNHITATYFLLAELRLRKRREEHFPKKPIHILLPDVVAAKTNISETKRVQMPDLKIKPTNSNKIALPINTVTQTAAETKNDKRSRKCSIVREEDEDESGYENANDGNELRVAVTRRESISDGRLNCVAQERTKLNTIIQDDRPKMTASIDATLVHKLNQIENHTVCDKNTKMDALNYRTSKGPAMDDALKRMKDLEIGKLNTLPMSNKNPVLTHRRSKLSKIRTPSCSSSEASDDDTKARSKKKINKFVGDNPTRFRMHRRDSHDDSSDSQDQSCPPSGSQIPSSQIVSNSNTSASGKKEGQKSNKEQNKTDDTRKNCNSHTERYKKTQKDDKEKNNRACNNLKSESLLIGTGRRRVRESQSLDRITEAQEYEFRQKCFTSDVQIDLRNSLFNVNTLTVAETKEECDEELNCADSERFKNNSIFSHKKSVNIRGSICKLNTIEDIDIILEDKSLSKAIQITGSKCFVTMKKIRKLGKYFPVVNFS
ncbi:SNF-related serine/threonine-protein kinase [Ceratitis capitata]|uniref:SNF-related serine/threonine-protein kinase n=1 Tax=Ceratitis capitata TaxID=7213 RepID=UPI000329C7FA|nr:SNF-related serine/threonine-protein kinase [Ceratitis capitata]XP_004526415.1 SNF-related serine/threonine-protein kinase [Ceratitis capitata]XP_020714865.1 SNF-related serine/threonine-protein kinase [Ceratitis capitata]